MKTELMIGAIALATIIGLTAYDARKVKALKVELQTVKADRYNVAFCLYTIMRNHSVSTEVIAGENGAAWNLSVKRMGEEWMIEAK